MKTNDIKTITSVAVATATLFVITFWSGSLEAVNDADGAAERIAVPKLVSQGVELALTAAQGRVFAAGDRPEFELTAVNPTVAPVEAVVQVAMTATSPADMLSRVMVMPATLWQTQQTIALRAHETKVLRLTASTNLPPGRMISVSLRPANPAGAPPALDGAGAKSLRPARPAAASAIVALRFSTVVPPATPPSVPALAKH